VTVAGQTVEINTTGLSAGGQTIPLPNPLAAVLKSEGITFAYVAPVKDPDHKGITAPGVTISAPLPLNQLPVGAVGDSPTTVTMTFGRGYAGVNGSFVNSGTTGGTGGTGGTGTGNTGGTGTSGGGSSAPGSSGGTGSVALPPSSSGDTGGTGSSTPPVVAGQPQQLQAAALNVPQIDWELVYLAITIGAFAVIGGGLLVRHLAERLRWT
jgi:hypothetical protein